MVVGEARRGEAKRLRGGSPHIGGLLAMRCVKCSLAFFNDIHTSCVGFPRGRHSHFAEMDFMSVRMDNNVIVSFINTQSEK